MTLITNCPCYHRNYEETDEYVSILIKKFAIEFENCEMRVVPEGWLCHTLIYNLGSLFSQSRSLIPAFTDQNQDYQSFLSSMRS